MKVKIEEVKLGKSGQGKYGLWQQVGLKINGQWHSGFADPPTANWQPGQELDLDLFEEAGQDGKIWKKFKVIKESNRPNPVPPMPSGSSGGVGYGNSQLDRMEEMLAKILEAVSGKAPGIQPPIEEYDGPPIEDLPC